MTGQDLLYKSRSGTRKSDDEDRRAIHFAGAAFFLEELPVEAGRDAAGFFLEFSDIEGLLLTPQNIAGRIVHEGFAIIAPLLESAPERKAQLCLGTCIRAWALQQRTHGRQLGCGKRVVLEVGETPISLGAAGILQQALLVRPLTGLAAPQGFVQMTDRELERHLLWIETQSLLIGVERLALAKQRCIDGAERDPILRILRLNLEQVPRGPLRLE